MQARNPRPRLSWETYPFDCRVCGRPVELRRGRGIGRVFERGGDREHTHEAGLDPMISPDVVAQYLECLCGVDVLVTQDGQRFERSTGQLHSCPDAARPQHLEPHVIDEGRAEAGPIRPTPVEGPPMPDGAEWPVVDLANLPEHGASGRCPNGPRNGCTALVDVYPQPDGSARIVERRNRSVHNCYLFSLARSRDRQEEPAASALEANSPDRPATADTPTRPRPKRPTRQTPPPHRVSLGP